MFSQGLSTAASLSQVSGRGVGMDAIRRFLETVDGMIQVEQLEPLDENGDYYRFKFILSLPLESDKGSHIDQVA
ncbi:MAG: hypothetical protein ACOH5I_18740 [Oligoflexus sp.]